MQVTGYEGTADTSTDTSLLSRIISGLNPPISTPCPWVSTSRTFPPLPSSVTVTLDSNPARIVSAFCSTVASVSEPGLMIVNGPPGSGKTSVAIGIAQWLGPSRSFRGRTYCFVVLESEIALRNFAARLHSMNYADFKAIVSAEYLSSG
jgi:hypothetical protein